MIIQIRGTSGSGKSWAMRRVMEILGCWQPVYVEGRKRPLYYRQNGVAVLGHYESACGGCDTIGSARAVYEMIQSMGFGVIVCEGLLLSEDTKWSSQLKDLRVVYLTTPLGQCLDQIKKRRAEVGNTKHFNPNNTTNRVGVIERSRVKLSAMGKVCRRCPADQAVTVVLNWVKEAS